MDNYWNFEVIRDADTVWSSSFQQRWQQMLNSSEDKNNYFTVQHLRDWLHKEMKAEVKPAKLQFFFTLGTQKEDGSMAFMPFVIEKSGIFKRCVTVMKVIGCSDGDLHDPLFTGKEYHREFHEDYYRELSLLLQSEKKVDKIIIDGLSEPILGQQFYCDEHTMPQALRDKIAPFRKAFDNGCVGNIYNMIYYRDTLMSEWRGHKKQEVKALLGT